jgi:hypothetical protein
MKKTTCIQLVLITAALASCNRPMYQREDYDDMDDQPDSTNSCPLAESDLPPDFYTWSAGFPPYNLDYSDPFSINFYLDGYYFYRYPATIRRAGFGRIGGGSGHS